MGVFEQLLPLPATAATERRSAPRYRLHEPIPVILGRGDGTLVDVSLTGARVRHPMPVRLGTRVRLSFVWGPRRFAATTIVHASRVVALGSGKSGAATFESRLGFAPLSPDSAEVLDALLESLESGTLRRWVANLRGWWSEPRSTPMDDAFIRCRRRFQRWERKWTRDSSQPDDGFTVPASIDERELEILFRTWDAGGDDDRELIRDTARAAILSMR